MSSTDETFLYEEEAAAAAPLEAAYVKGDPEKAEKKNIMDSGIGLSGMGLSGVSLQDSSFSLESANIPAKCKHILEIISNNTLNQ